MNKDNNVYLEDIIRAINKIEEYLKGISLESFLDDTMRQDAVIRHLEIIGEAATRVSKQFLNENPDFPLKEAIRMRNFLIHGYDHIDVNIVWKTIQQDLPPLKNKILAIKSST